MHPHMPERILIGVAWPYASGPRHIGHAVSTFIPADIFARYHRMKGDDVLMVGGSDMHGTPTTVRADEEGVAPQVIADRYHALHTKNIEQLGVQYDLYWNTADPRHKADVQEIFLKLREKGYIEDRTMASPYCSEGDHYLPDRYVEGSCPHCGFLRARGDQCEQCGHLLDPFDLGNPKCRIHKTTPVPRDVMHAFFRLSAFQDRLAAYVEGKSYWRPPVLTFTKAWLREGLKDRPITRDLDWGIEVPLPGWDGKRIYVWFEAVMGYLTASRECWRQRGQPDKWRDWWYDSAARHYYFVGKDNIVFHTLFWPAILMGYDEKLMLPFDVPATQYMNISGEKMSAGRGRGVWLPDLLERFDPDAIRYYATATMPELRDSEFDWADFAQRNNSELLAVYGNFVHRALTFTSKNFGGVVPEVGFLDAVDKAMVRNIEEQWRKVGTNLDFVHFRDALREIIQLARLGNQYFDQKAPWDLVRKDKAACGTTLHVSLRVSKALATMLAPFLPFSSQRLWQMLGYDTKVHDQKWAETLDDVRAGQKLRVGKPLFERVELKPPVAESEADLFDIRVGQIVDVKDHPRGDKLYVLEVDLGDEKRQLVAGIRQNYTKEQIAGKRIAVLCNLQPAKLRGIESNGMLLAAESGGDVGILMPPAEARTGTQILGKRGAPMMGFDEFQKFKFVVGEEQKAYFLGSRSLVRIPLVVDSGSVIADKGMKEGAVVR